MLTTGAARSGSLRRAEGRGARVVSGEVLAGLGLGEREAALRVGGLGGARLVGLGLVPGQPRVDRLVAAVRTATQTAVSADMLPGPQQGGGD